MGCLEDCLVENDNTAKMIKAGYIICAYRSAASTSILEKKSPSIRTVMNIRTGSVFCFARVSFDNV
jgi:hypothetical protein